MRTLWILGVLLGLSACTTTTIKDSELPLSRNNMCAESVGASLRYNTVTMALGQRPNVGYGIELVAQKQRAGVYQLSYQEQRPQVGKHYAQMMTSPCIQVVLPHNWKSVTVLRTDTKERWSFTPESAANKKKAP